MHTSSLYFYFYETEWSEKWVRSSFFDISDRESFLCIRIGSIGHDHLTSSELLIDHFLHRFITGKLLGECTYEDSIIHFIYFTFTDLSIEMLQSGISLGNDHETGSFFVQSIGDIGLEHRARESTRRVILLDKVVE